MSICIRTSETTATEAKPYNITFTINKLNFQFDYGVVDFNVATYHCKGLPETCFQTLSQNYGLTSRSRMQQQDQR